MALVTRRGAGYGRAEQPEIGRHSPEYLRRVAPDRGMCPMGHAGRVPLAVHLADGAQDVPTLDRGDRHTWQPPGP